MSPACSGDREDKDRLKSVPAGMERRLRLPGCPVAVSSSVQYPGASDAQGYHEMVDVVVLDLHQRSGQEQLSEAEDWYVTGVRKHRFDTG